MIAFKRLYRPRLDDIDYMGHVGNAHWLTMLMRAREDYVEEIGFPMEEFFKQKIGVVVAEANIKYLRPAFFNQPLTFSIEVLELWDKGALLKQDVLDEEGKTCLDCHFRMVFVNDKGRPIEVPETIRTAWSKTK